MSTTTSNKGFSFPGWFINNNPLFKSSFENVIQWGDNSYKRYYGGWHGANNATFLASDVPNTSAIVDFSDAWNQCASLTSFPSIDTCNGKDFSRSWQGCTSLSSFPWLCMSNAETVFASWANCTSLTSLPLVDLYKCEDFSYAWFNCSNLTNLPRLSTHSGKNFNKFVEGCPKLSSAPLQGTRENHSFANCNLQAPAIIDIFYGLADVNPLRKYIDITNNPGIPDLSRSDFLIAWEKGWGVIPNVCPDISLEDGMTCIELEWCVNGTYPFLEKENTIRYGALPPPCSPPPSPTPTPTPTPTLTLTPTPTPTLTPTLTPTPTSIPLNPTYQIVPDVTNVNEDSTVVTFTVTTTDVPAGTNLYWYMIKEGDINSSDFTGNGINGSVPINSSGIGTISTTVRPDNTTETIERFKIALKTSSVSPVVVASSVFVTINDTSLGAPTIIPDKTFVTEGSAVAFSVTIPGATAGNTYYWTTLVVDGILNSSNFSDNIIEGSFVLAGGGPTIINRAVANDGINNGIPLRSFRLQLRQGSVSGSLIGSSSTITILPSAQIIPSSTTVNEGDTITFTVNTFDVPDLTSLRYRIVNSTNESPFNAADFTDNLVTDLIDINSNTASFSKTLTSDMLLEGNEQFRVLVDYVQSPSFYKLAESPIITINDTSRPFYSIIPDVTSVLEGGNVTFTVSTTGVPIGTSLYWTTESINDWWTGTVTASDFNDDLMNGSITTTGSPITFIRNIKDDLVHENTERFVIRLRTGSATGPIVATSSLVLIVSPTYSLAASSNDVCEGESLTFNVITTNVPAGTTLYWNFKPSGSTATTADFTGGAASGDFLINSNNTGTFTTPVILADAIDEGNETFNIELRTGSNTGQLVATSSTITIIGKTYNVTPSTTSVTEGNSVTFTVYTTNIPIGTDLYWTTTGTANSSDFTDNSMSGGPITIASGTWTNFGGRPCWNRGIATFVRDITAGDLAENTENFAIEIRTGSIAGPVVATSQTVNIIDSSIKTYSVIPNKTTMNEGETITFDISSTNVVDGTYLYLELSFSLLGSTIGKFTTLDTTLTQPNRIPIQINSNLGTYTLTTVNDLLTEGTETFDVKLYTVATGSTPVAATPIITINDTSTGNTIEGTAQCGEVFNVFSGAAGKWEYTVNLGLNTGNVTLNYDASDVPDRFEVYWNGARVIDTGFVGDSSYNTQLAALGYSNVAGTPSGSRTFNKTLSVPTSAYVYITAPINDTVWKASLTCP